VWFLRTTLFNFQYYDLHCRICAIELFKICLKFGLIRNLIGCESLCHLEIQAKVRTNFLRKVETRIAFFAHHTIFGQNFEEVQALTTYQLISNFFNWKLERVEFFNFSPGGILWNVVKMCKSVFALAHWCSLTAFWHWNLSCVLHRIWLYNIKHIACRT
jgi:hypothetical protein